MSNKAYVVGGEKGCNVGCEDGWDVGVDEEDRPICESKSTRIKNPKWIIEDSFRIKTVFLFEFITSN